MSFVVSDPADADALADHYLRVSGVPPVGDFRQQAIDYKPIAPAKVEKIIDLVELFERTKKHKADAWQIDMCERLERAFFNRHLAATLSMIHAEGQLGKSVILAQLYSAWILGHDPLHRIALATYNVTRSQAHSKAIIGLMNTPIYRQIFRDPGCHIKRTTSKEKWQTPARAGKGTDAEGTEAQDSFNPVGLQSGLTGSGMDTLLIDDPYADQKEAFSETTRANLQAFWEYTVISRLEPYTNVFGMFHRYHVQDLAGYLLDKGTFDYWRYASICDGPYIHPETGTRYEDPLGRELGVVISPLRRPLSWYAEAQKNPQMFLSMNQGRPNAEEGGFFKTAMIRPISPEQGMVRLREAAITVRGWDNAASENSGDWTAGIKISMRRDKGVTIHHGEMIQAATEDRYDTQKRITIEDGRLTVVAIPKDPGSAGKDVARGTEKLLEGYTVEIRGTSQNKQERARNFAHAVNSGRVEIVSDDDLPPEKKWNKRFLRSLQEFPLSTFDDPVDGGSDAFNTADETLNRGTVIKNYTPQNNLMLWATFASYFSTGTNGNSAPCKKIPANFTIYVGVKITPDANQANSAAIVARAPTIAGMDGKLFLVAEYKEWTDDWYKCFDWIDKATKAFCSNPKASCVYLHPESESYKQTIWQQLNVPIAVFAGDEFAGLTELDWHMKATEQPSKFGLPEDTGFYGIVHDASQIGDAKDEFGLINYRQEALTWTYNDKKKPNALGGVLECVRMVAYAFRTTAAPLTKSEKIEAALAPQLRAEAIAAMPDSPDKDSMLTRRTIEAEKVAKELDKPVRGPHASKWARR